jgi:hypothetical protein
LWLFGLSLSSLFSLFRLGPIFFGFDAWLSSYGFGFWLLAFGLWPLAFGLWPLAFGLWPLAFGPWLLAFSFWPWALAAQWP